MRRSREYKFLRSCLIFLRGMGFNFWLGWEL